MLRDIMIDHWIEELDKEIYDLLELREEVAGEKLVIEDGTVRQVAVTVPLNSDYDEETLKSLLGYADERRQSLINYYLKEYRKRSVQMEDQQ